MSQPIDRERLLTDDAYLDATARHVRENVVDWCERPHYRGGQVRLFEVVDKGRWIVRVDSGDHVQTVDVPQDKAIDAFHHPHCYGIN